MKMMFAATALVTFMIANVPVGVAFETDQYNLPPTPLVDIGDEMTAYVSDNVSKAAANVNERIAAAEACLAITDRRPKGCGSANAERKKLDELRSVDAPPREVFKLLGDGVFPLSHVGSWLKSHDFHAGPVRYKTAYKDSIYVILPTNYLTISPTIKMYGTEFGVDKIEHFFQQGYSYLKIYRKAAAKGSTPDAAAQKAIKWGQMTERTYYGFLVSGVFSNADLYANYVGMKFYLGLTQPTKTGDVTRPPTLVLENGRWKLNEVGIRAVLIKPFITDHMNEALNPSGFSAILFPFVRNVVRKRACGQWQKAFPDYNRGDLNLRSRSLRLWNGEDYGFTEKKRMISVGDLCY